MGKEETSRPIPWSEVQVRPNTGERTVAQNARDAVIYISRQVTANQEETRYSTTQQKSNICRKSQQIFPRSI